MFLELLIFVSISFCAYILFKLMQIDFSYYQKRNLKYKFESFDFCNIIGMLFQLYTVKDCSDRLYNAFPGEK